jgi:chloride channel protein, CIC family
VFPASRTLRDVTSSFRPDHSPRGRHLYPVLDEGRRLLGVVTRKDVRKWFAGEAPAGTRIGELARPAEVAYEDEPLRVVVNRMAETGLTRLPVLESPGGPLAGIVSLQDLLRARTRNLAEERDRERVLRIRLPFGRRPVAQ